MEETIFVSNSPPGDSWTLKHDRYGPLEHLASPVCSDSMLFSGVHLSDESPLYDLIVIHWASQGVLVVKNPPANAGDVRDMGSILGSAWQPTQVFLPGESHEQRRLAGYSPQGHEE